MNKPTWFSPGFHLAIFVSAFVILLGTSGCGDSKGARGHSGKVGPIGLNGEHGNSGDDGRNGKNGDKGDLGPIAPMIESIHALGTPSQPGAQITVSVSALSGVGSLSFEWQGFDGFTVATGGNTSTASITSPLYFAQEGTASVIITNSLGLKAMGVLTLQTSGNGRPVIDSLSVLPQPVLSFGTFQASGWDPDQDLLTYVWYLGGVSVGTNSTTDWVNPGIPGDLWASVSLSDGFNDTVSASVSTALGVMGAWPRFHGDLQNTGRQRLYAPAPTGSIAWQKPGVWCVSSAIVGADRTIYVPDLNGTFYAYRSDGTVKWSFAVGSPIYSAPAIDEAQGNVYFGSWDFKLYALRISDGTLRWSYNAGSYIHSGINIAPDGTIYFTTWATQRLIALRKDGTLKWELSTSGVNHSIPAIGPDGTIYFGSRDSKLYAVTPSGVRKWTYLAGNDVFSPTVGQNGGRIWFGSRDGKTSLVDASGNLVWSYPAGTTTLKTPPPAPAIGVDGTAYVGSDDFKLYALSLNGEKRWAFATGGKIQTSPVIGSDGTIYVGSDDFYLYAIQPSGQLKWKALTGGTIQSTPAFGSSGELYFGTGGPYFYRVN